MRRRYQVLTLIVLTGATAVAAHAQDSVRVRRQPRDGEPRGFVFSMGPEDFRVDMRRGRLGITVDLRPDAARDSVGARVSGVTPGGPADRAGVQTGDLITRLNGSRLVGDAVRGNDGNDDDGPDQSRPGLRLISLASRLEPGDTVRLDIKRDTRMLTLTFQADRTEMDNLVERMRVPGPGLGLMQEFGPRMPGGSARAGPMSGTMRMMVRTDGVGGMELVTVTPQLARGLGIEEGVLVVSIDSGNTLGLQAGDVITAIAGRHPTSPAHAMRILGSYDPGENVSFDVMRQHRRTTVNGKVPEPRTREWRIRPNSFDEMLPTEPMMRFFDGDGPMIQVPKLIRLDGRV